MTRRIKITLLANNIRMPYMSIALTIPVLSCLRPAVHYLQDFGATMEVCGSDQAEGIRADLFSCVFLFSDYYFFVNIYMYVCVYSAY